MFRLLYKAIFRLQFGRRFLINNCLDLAYIRICDIKMRYKKVFNIFYIKMYFTFFMSHFYISYSNVNEISYFKDIANFI
jgi:hypothetical protein